MNIDILKNYYNCFSIDNIEELLIFDD